MYITFFKEFRHKKATNQTCSKLRRGIKREIIKKEIRYQLCISLITNFIFLVCNIFNVI